ncbi:MAG TPA: hypothetical protein VFX39_03075 [Gemmatimonadaceae bacterium]|nr:hypothetical protein [Gemmatimonadaceae bacterium]
MTVPVAFRLPCPPAWDDRRPAAWAAERRARRAYFATLDALRTGSIDPVEEAKIGRLLDDLRSSSAQQTLRHFQRILDHVRGLAGRPTIPGPPAPMRSVVIAAPSQRGPRRPPDLTARYRWALDWLEARHYVAAGKELRVDWRFRKEQGVEARV